MKDGSKIQNLIIYLLVVVLIILVVVYENVTIGDVDVLAFIGAVIGGIITLIGVQYTIKSSFEGLKNQNDFTEEMTRIANRSYLSVQEFIGPFKLQNIETSYKSRIILTKDYDEFVGANTEESLKGSKTTFYQFKLHGTPDIIVNCNIKITLQMPDSDHPFIIESHVGIFEKEEEVFIPLFINGIREINAVRAEAEYTTVYNEKIYYLYDVEEKTEGYWLLDEQKKEKIFDFKLRNSNWSYPNRNKK